MTDPTLAASLTPAMREALVADVNDFGHGRYRLRVWIHGRTLAALHQRGLIDKYSGLLSPAGLALRSQLKGAGDHAGAQEIREAIEKEKPRR